MRCYAAHATSARNRSALGRAGWGLLCSAAYRWTDPDWCSVARGGTGLALDNGAWSAHAAGRAFDDSAFRRAVEEQDGPDALDFVVCPDVVMDADGTRRMADRWLGWCLERAQMVLLPVQDGMDGDQLPLGPRVGVFVGGSTAWKERTAHTWASRARTAGAWCHVGRVNSARRLVLCRLAGVHSIDGSGPSRFEEHLRQMEAGRRMNLLF